MNLQFGTLDQYWKHFLNNYTGDNLPPKVVSRYNEVFYYGIAFIAYLIRDSEDKEKVIGELSAELLKWQEKE